ncbi:MAG: ABC transporter permease, partial [Candidatus Aenigmatarchaeota archaeon]
MSLSYSTFREYVRFAFLTVRHRQKRSWLTVLGIFIGIAAVVGLVSISQGLKDAVVGQFESIGADTITVMAGKLGAGPPGFGSNPLTDKDVETIEGVRGVGVVAPVLVRNTKVVFQNEEKYTYVMGLPPKQIQDILFTTEGMHVIEGRITGEGDKYGAVIGYSIADTFFEKDVGIGDKIEIAGQDFRVRGRLSKIGNPTDDSQIYINIETARTIFGQPTEVSTIMVKADSSADPEKVAIDIKKALEKERGEEDFTVLTAAQLSEMVQSILGVVQIVLVGIAGISLLVGGVGIMNTMYT